MKEASQEIGCIFDLDGVLVSTAVLHVKSWQVIADDLGISLPPDFAHLTKGLSRLHSLKVLLGERQSDFSEKEQMEMCSKKNNAFLQLIQENEDRLLESGTMEFLEQLSANSIPCCVASASNNAVSILRILKLDHHFSTIIEARNVSQTKPHPEAFIRASRILQLRENQCYVFEDSPKAIIEAKKQGFKTIGIGAHEDLKVADLQCANLGHIALETLM